MMIIIVWHEQCDITYFRGWIVKVEEVEISSSWIDGWSGRWGLEWSCAPIIPCRWSCQGGCKVDQMLLIRWRWRRERRSQVQRGQNKTASEQNSQEMHMLLLLLNVLSNLHRETGDNVKFAIPTERREKKWGRESFIIAIIGNQREEGMMNAKDTSSCMKINIPPPPEELSCFPCRGEEYNIIAYLDHIVLRLITTTTTAVHDQNSFPLITFPFSVCSPVEFLLRHPLHMSDPCSPFAPPHHLQLLTEWLPVNHPEIIVCKWLGDASLLCYCWGFVFSFCCCSSSTAPSISTFFFWGDQRGENEECRADIVSWDNSFWNIKRKASMARGRDCRCQFWSLPFILCPSIA